MCKHPLKGFKIGYTSSGRVDYKITSYKAHHVERVCGVWQVSMNHFVSKHVEEASYEWIEIPCGQCVECRLNYSRQWANRCMLELLDHDPKECWFITLTYDNDHVHKILDEPLLLTLDKADLQKFWKRLRITLERSGFDRNVRYYACGEYGSNTFRPHYHAIVYSCPLEDLVPWGRSKSGHPLFRSPWLENIWQNGIVTVAPVTWESCAYTARYVMKKVDGFNREWYTDLGLVPEFTVMSRCPGIARSYYDEFKNKIYKFDELVLPEGVRCKPPRYFDSLFEADDPDRYEQIKESRKDVAERNREMKLSKTDKDYLSMLQAEEENLVKKMKLLRRDQL